MLAVVGPVGVDVELDVVADRDSRRVQPRRVVVRVAPDLHLHARDPSRDPTGELVGETVERIRGEAAASVDGRLVTDRSEQVGERRPEETCLQIPQGDVHGRKGHEPEPRTPDVPQFAAEAVPGTGHVLELETADERRELVLDQPRRSVVRVGVAEPDLVTGICLHDDDRRRVPLERPVGLGCVGGNRAG